MSSWPVGKDRLLELLGSRELERVVPNPEHASRLLEECRGHIVSGRTIGESDPTGAYQLGYSALRKACAALLAHQGLRATKAGGHITVFDAVQAQFNGPHGSQSFAKLHYFRRMRGGAEYPTEDTPPTVPEDADDCLDRAEAVLADATTLLRSGKLDVFDN